MSSTERDTDPAVEAARYAVLRRIGPALRHDLVVNLQALAMMAEVLSTRLERLPADPAPGDAHLASHLTRLHRLARQAVANSLQVAQWISPDDDDTIELHQGLHEVLDLVRSSFGFRGFALQLQDAATAEEFTVPHDRLRHLVLAALIHMADEAPATGILRVCGWIQDDQACIRLDLETVAGPDAPARLLPDLGYRALSWADVQALAGDAPPRRQPDPPRILLRLPRERALSPLGMAPR